jgi:hypothetical protein
MLDYLRREMRRLYGTLAEQVLAFMRRTCSHDGVARLREARGRASDMHSY